MRGLGPVERLAALLLVAGTALGVALTITGAVSRYRWLLLAHIAVSSAGALLALAVVAARLVPQVRGRLRPAHGIAVVLLLAAAGWSTAMVIRQRGAGPGAFRIVNPPAPPISMDGEGGGPQSPFFPSSANTNVNGIIPANFFMTSKTCERCHKDIYDQWNSSMHHFSSFNNQWYRKSIEYMQDVVGTKPSKWCAGCHDHAVFFNGRFDKPIKEQIETPEAQAGLACTSCHSISHVGSTMGQGDFTIEYPPLHDLAASSNPLLAFAHDRLTFLDPAPHRNTFLKPFHTRADAGVLLVVSQGAPRRARERLPLVPRLQRLRQLAGLGHLRRGRALLLLPAEADEVRRLPHAARAFERSGGDQRHGALAPLPRREYGHPLRQRRRGAAEDDAAVPAGRCGVRGHLRPGARR